jgi:hypothetical protein
MESRAAARARATPLLDRTNLAPPYEVEVDWQKTVAPATQLTVPEDLQSTDSGSVCYPGDTQREMM